MTLEELRIKHREGILRIAADYGVTDIRVFGSVARGEATEDSDIDLLVTIPRTMHLYDYVRAELEIQDKIGVPVQMISDEGVNDLLRDRIFSEAVPL